MPDLPIAGGRMVLLDDEDFAMVSAYRWYASRTGRQGRPVRSVKNEAGQYIEVPMARVLVPHLSARQHVRYRNGDAFDLRRENLIVPSENSIAPSPGARGVVGELMVAADLFRHGFEVFTPVHGYGRVDLIALSASGQTHRVQVKSSVSTNGVLEASLKSVSTNSQGHTVRPLSPADIDLLAIYDATTQKIAYLGSSELTTGLSISVSAVSRVQAAAKLAYGRRSKSRWFMEELSDPKRALLQNSPGA